MTTKRKTPGDEAGGGSMRYFDGQDSSENTGETQEDTDGVAGLHAYIRERGKSARDDVAKWNARVEAWRNKHGDKFIPRKAFVDHPAAEMLAGIFEQSNIVEHEGALELASRVLSVSNDGLRRTAEDLPQYVAQLLDVAHLSGDPAASYVKARLWGLMGQVCGLLLELRTTTSEEIHGLPVENIPACILARTADVRESGDHA
ncbi:conserved hypothetical protein [Altererythrobacter sp. B11]|uniref:hypothetical protein n=1 Tax=Altererythrobacter sp. B11 TaxID=2060312 RepID=UPI000DC73028|nr:hypothetical protein [Altererythrobacter sp. B11]BBC73370.1 conserved hypothetical protein [Altererythrobacter sp. B11]